MFYDAVNFRADSIEANIRILERIAMNGLLLDKDPLCYPRWFEYDYGITDPYSKVQELIVKGYACLAPTEMCLSKVKVADLKAELLKQGLSDKGKKDELISRLISNGIVSDDFAPQVAIITDSGRHYLQHHEEEMFAESLQRFEVSADEYFLCKKELGSMASREQITIMVLEIKSRVENLDIWVYLDIQKELARLYDNAGDKQKALIHHIYSAYYCCCLNAAVLEETTHIDADYRNPIYFHREFFSSNIIDDVENLFVPITGNTKRYSIERFRRQINEILQSTTYEMTIGE